MARRTVTAEEKLEKAQEELLKAKKKYDECADEVSRLMKICDKERMEKLVAAVSKSSRTFEEIMAFIQSSEEEKED